MSAAGRPDRNTLALAALRIAVGVLFLFFGEYKVFGTGFAWHGGFQGWIRRFLDDRVAYPFMVPVLRDFVLAHPRPIALLVSYGELAIGISLTLGLLVRAASAFGLIYMLTLMFSANYPGAGAVPWMYLGAALDHLVLALCFAAFVIGDSERALALGSRRAR
jgi:thiosulfate dehydrogenase [quinone] large subunit